MLCCNIFPTKQNSEQFTITDLMILDFFFLKPLRGHGKCFWPCWEWHCAWTNSSASGSGCRTSSAWTKSSANDGDCRTSSAWTKSSAKGGDCRTYRFACGPSSKAIKETTGGKASAATGHSGPQNPKRWIMAGQGHAIHAIFCSSNCWSHCGYHWWSRCETLAEQYVGWN